MSSGIDAFPEVVTECILVVDSIESTATSDLFGWYAVGRGLMRDLRSTIVTIGQPLGMRCLKSTGDGYLVTFGDAQSAEMSVVHAATAAFDILGAIEVRNALVPEERAIHLRMALHLGQVDVLENDREGPDVSYTFRIESLSTGSLAKAVNPVPIDDFPLRDYVLCSERVVGVLDRRVDHFESKVLGLFKLKGFSGRHDIFQLRRR